MTSVYSPIDRRLRGSFWNELDSIRSRWNGPLCLGGDWNVVRFPSEKLNGSQFSADMIAFSDWINCHSLVDLHLGGSKLTWSNHQNLPSMSRLDIFLLSNDWINLYPKVCQITLAKKPISDHYPILLDSFCERWGPSAFRFELMWLEGNNFEGLIKNWWVNLQVKGLPGHRCSLRLRNMKAKIKEWVKSSFGEVEAVKSKILEELEAIENGEESHQLSADEVGRRLQLKEMFQKKVREEEIK